MTAFTEWGILALGGQYSVEKVVFGYGGFAFLSFVWDLGGLDDTIWMDWCGGLLYIHRLSRWILVVCRRRQLSISGWARCASEGVGRARSVTYVLT